MKRLVSDLFILKQYWLTATEAQVFVSSDVARH